MGDEFDRLKAAASVGYQFSAGLESPYKIVGAVGPLAYYSRDNAIADAKRYRLDGFDVRVVTSFGRQLWPSYADVALSD